MGSGEENNSTQTPLRHCICSYGGFTLIEVLMALTIISIGLLGTAVLIYSISNSNRSSTEATMATTLAHDYLESLRNVGFETAPSVGAADDDDGYGTITDYPSFRRVTSSAAVAGGYDSAKMKEVTVTVYWEDDDRSLALTTVLTK